MPVNLARMERVSYLSSLTREQVHKQVADDSMVAKVLQRPALVLNRVWQPVNVATVARSLVMMWNDSALAIDPGDYQAYSWAEWAKLAPREGEPFIQAVSRRLRAPEVIKLTDYDRLPVRSVAFSRRNIFKRDHYACQYCGVRPLADELSIDHVVPRSLGGQTTWDNCVLACVACNKRKAGRTPAQAGMVLRKRPSRPVWKPSYAHPHAPIASWSKFVSEAYWNVELES